MGQSLCYGIQVCYVPALSLHVLPLLLLLPNQKVEEAGEQWEGWVVRQRKVCVVLVSKEGYRQAGSSAPMCSLPPPCHLWPLFCKTCVLESGLVEKTACKVENIHEGEKAVR